MKRIVVAFASFVFFAAGTAGAAEYTVDKSHTSVGFSVKHMVISNVKGNFNDFSGSFTFDDKTGALTRADAVVKAASINTNEPKRDDHLKSPEFLDVAKFPEIVFKLDSAESTGDNQIRAVGHITIHGVTKEMVLQGEFIGAAKDPWGNTRAGFTASGVINRGDFGLTWNKVLDQGGVVVGEQVKLLIEVEGIQQKPADVKKH